MTNTTTRSTGCPKHLDEKVARIHVEALGGNLTKLTKDQAEYLGVDVEGPYKPTTNRLLIEQPRSLWPKR